MVDETKFEEAVTWVRGTPGTLSMLERLHARDRAVRSARRIQDGSPDIDDAPAEAVALYAHLETGNPPFAAYLRRELPSRSPARTAGRNRAIILAIRNVMEVYRLPATRPNRADVPRECCAAGGSACDVVGAALKGLVHLTYSRIKGIWAQRTKKPGA